MPTHASNDSVFSGYNVFLQSKDGVQDATHGPSKCDFYLDRIIKPERYRTVFTTSHKPRETIH